MRKVGQQGFTMAELFVVIAVIVVLAAIAVPVFGNVMPRIRLREGAQEVYRVMQLAKLEAVKRNRKVFLEFAGDSGACKGGDLSRATVSYEMYYLDNGAKNGVTRIAGGFLPPAVALCSESTLKGRSRNGGAVVMAAFRSNGLPGKRPGGGAANLPNGSVRLGNSKGRIVSVVLAKNGGIRIQ